MRHALLLSLAGFACMALVAQEGSAPLSPEAALAAWGKAFNPDDDCKFSAANGELSIRVPGDHAHDLAPELEVMNAPRVLQPVAGDFTIQVCVDGRFEPGAESTLDDRTSYHGAGITIVADAQNVVTLARAALQRSGEEVRPYANFEIRVGGKLQRFGLSSDLPLPKAGPVYLRLERRGAEFLAAVSTDGSTWESLPSKPVPPTWPKEAQAGVVAISSSLAEFEPKFSKLQVIK